MFGAVRKNGIAIVATIGLLAIVGAPLAMVVAGSFRGPADFLPFDKNTYWTIANYIEVFSDREFWETLRDTGIYSTGSVLIALGFGVTIGWLVGRTDLPGKRVVFLLMLVPVTMPPVISAMSWLMLLGTDTGYVNVLLRGILPFWQGPGPINPFSMTGMIIVQGMSLAAFAYVLTISAVTNLDPALEEASRTSGAGFWTTLFRVTAPALRPALLATLIVAVIFAIEGIEVPLLLGVGAGVRVLSLQVYRGLNPSDGLPLWGHVLTLAVFFLLMSYLMFIAYQRLTARAEQFATISGKGFKPRPLELGAWRWLALIPVAFYLLLQVIFPLALLVWTSLHRTFVPFSLSELSTLTFDSYSELFRDPRLATSVGNTILVAAGSATLVSILTGMAAWTVVRSKSWLRLGLDLLASSSIAIPAILAGIAFLIFYITVPNPLYGTIWLLVVAFSYRTAVSYRLHRSTMTQIGKELEEASLVSGASSATTLVRIVMPLLAPGLLISWLLIFMIGTREFTLPMLLGQREMLGPMLYYKLSVLGQATALATLTLIGIGIIAFAAYWFLSRSVRRF